MSNLDLSMLSPKARNDYILAGRQFGSNDTLAQANQTLKGLASHGAELIAHGFAASDAARLTAARDALVEAGVGRDEARGDKKVTSATYLASMKAGKEARETARSILTGARRALNEKADPPSEDAVKQIDAALQQTRSAGTDAAKLADQLDLLRGVLEETPVANEAAERGGPAAQSDLLAKAADLRSAAAARTSGPGTPAETEQLDLLDGIILALTRDAFKAASAAAKRLGKPALVADFELTRLYDRRNAAPAAPAEPADTGAPPATPETPAGG